jgi:phosphoribosylformylglycinamidine synthase
MKFGVVVFPGSNCDHDAWDVLHRVLGQETQFLWHKDSSLGNVDVVLLPGGFSYGDYLRCGAIARFSPIMKEVGAFAQRGGVVVGICNGFQILCEAGLLPGAFLRNECMTFVCKQVHLRVENVHTRFTANCEPGEILRVPIAHGEGNYQADDAVLREMERNGQILFRYSEHDGSVTASSNPNGSRSNIAGIMNARGNVMGMMPHPERAADPALGNTDGQKIFLSLIESFVLHEQITDQTIS